MCERICLTSRAGLGKEKRRAVKDTHSHFHTVLICRKAFRLLVTRLYYKSSVACLFQQARTGANQMLSPKNVREKKDTACATEYKTLKHLNYSQ